MNFKGLTIGLLATALLAGCSGSPTPGASSTSTPAAAATEAAPAGFVIKVGGAEVPFEVKTARADVRPDVTEAQFSVANYDFQMNHMEANSVERSKADGEVRVAFSLKGEKGEDFQNPVQPGEYSGDKLIWMDVYQGKGGEDTITTNLENATGGVTIKTVTDTELTGTIDVKGDNGLEVKGDFTAQRVPKE